jgi:hypothetical protein
MLQDHTVVARHLGIQTHKCCGATFDKGRKKHLTRRQKSCKTVTGVAAEARSSINSYTQEGFLSTILCLNSLSYTLLGLAILGVDGEKATHKDRTQGINRRVRMTRREHLLIGGVSKTMLYARRKESG